MRRQCIPGSFFSAYAKEPGDEARPTEDERKKERKKERWTTRVGGDIQNVDFKRDSGEDKGCNQRGRPCTARVDGLNRVKLQHNEGIC